MKYTFFNFINRASDEDDGEKLLEAEKRFIKACNLIKEQRERYEISRKELAISTKISIVVLESIENGWIEHFPERTFLKQMLIKIENELCLPKNSLIDILNKSSSPSQNKPTRTITAIKINMFRSWYGNLIYSILMLLSILALNKQQYYLSIINSLTISPINLNEEVIYSPNSDQINPNKKYNDSNKN